MAIESHPGDQPPAPPGGPAWGELAPEGRTAATIRFALDERVVTFPVSELRRWEHVPGERETLTIHAGKDAIVIEGRELSIPRAALDLGRLCELRITHPRTKARPGPQIFRIAIEPA